MTASRIVTETARLIYLLRLRDDIPTERRNIDTRMAIRPDFRASLLHCRRPPVHFCVKRNERRKQFIFLA